MTALFLALLVLSGCSARNGTEPSSPPSVRTELIAEEILSLLSVDEKLNLLSGAGGGRPVNLAESVLGAAGFVNGIRNGKADLPALVLADGPAGVRLMPTRSGDDQTYYATSWPVGTLLASTWDGESLYRVGQAMGEEAAAYGVDFLLAPGMNIQRNPLAGRNFEYFSEDPLLTGRMGSALVKGIQSEGVGATVKHFFGNESETNRMALNVLSDPRSLREIYMRGFRIAVEDALPQAVMSPYNSLNNRWVNERKDALTDILRGEWGFTGLVMSDWYAGSVRFDPESSARQVKAGNDLIMPGGVFPYLKQSYERGTLTGEEIDTSALRVLRQLIRSQKVREERDERNPRLKEHEQLALETGADGMVLLKNEGALPIAPGASLALFGTAQYVTYKGGTGSGNVSSSHEVNMAEGLEGVFSLEEGLKDYYHSYYLANRIRVQDGFAPWVVSYSLKEPSYGDDEEWNRLLAASALESEAALITISRQAGEGQDRRPVKGEYYLTDNEREMIERVSAAFRRQGKTVTVILNVDGVVDTDSWSSLADGILLAWMGGQETGNQAALIISGEVNPSGKLAQTIPRHYEDVPSSSTFPGTDANGDGNPDYILNNEGIYVGYRYYSTFGITPAYPFGFGLSYTDFFLDRIVLSHQNLEEGETGSLGVTVRITNRGTRAGRETAQLYVSAPQGRLEKPSIELKAFAKTDLLEPGETEEMELTVPARDLASFDPEKSAWILEPGEYALYAGRSSDISGIEPVRFTLEKEQILSETHRALALPEGISADRIINVKR